MGVSFAFNTTVRAIECHGDRVRAVHTDKGPFPADAFLVALGPYSPILLRPIGLNLPIWPVKGYTASIPIGGHRGAPKVGIIEEDNLVAFANLGDTLRVGGKAEFTGYDTSYAEADFQGIMSVSRELFRMPATTAGRAIGPAYGR